MPIPIKIETERHAFRQRKRKVAHVLLVDSNLAPRLTLKSLLSTAGYAVDSAATTAEAVEKLDDSEYQLVLADLRSESDEAGPSVLAYARQKEYRPATALLCSDLRETTVDPADSPDSETLVRISHEDVSNLLARVAELISQRASRRINRSRRF
jgi:CheY-like chemotaxis protein